MHTLARNDLKKMHASSYNLEKWFLLLTATALAIEIIARIRGRAVQVGNSGTEAEVVAVYLEFRLRDCIVV
jgi:hypothetical protein